MGQDYASGRNPRDQYRGREIMPDQVCEAGGERAHSALARAIAKELGGSILLNLDPVTSQADAATAVERAAKLPVIGNVVKRFVRVSDYGLDQQAQETLRADRKQQAGRSLDRDDAIREALRSGTDLAAAFRRLRDAGTIPASGYQDFRRRAEELRRREFGSSAERVQSKARTKRERQLLAGGAGAN
jgi:hypothetical protein